MIKRCAEGHGGFGKNCRQEDWREDRGNYIMKGDDLKCLIMVQKY